MTLDGAETLSPHRVCSAHLGRAETLALGPIFFDTPSDLWYRFGAFGSV